MLLSPSKLLVPEAHATSVMMCYIQKFDAINKIVQQTKTALHRTRLRFSYQEIISVSLFFKALSPLAAAESLRLIRLTEIVERNFTFFQFRKNFKPSKLWLNY